MFFFARRLDNPPHVETRILAMPFAEGFASEIHSKMYAIATRTLSLHSIYESLPVFRAAPSSLAEEAK